ncbi:RNA-directed DNA polymerase, eukaryota, reverse transcriptase zinc-binding domain protein [Tanacetum coccineum]
MKNPLNNLAWKTGNLFQHVKKIENELKNVQMAVEANPNRKEVKMKLSNVLQEYNEAINDVEKLLAQKEVVFGIGNDKAPGPDGYTAKFFKTSWDIVGGDVCGAVKEFFKSNNLLGESAFALGRLIQDNLLLTQELLKGYNRKIRPKICALKIDIAKAYDIVDLILTQLCFADDLLMLCNGDHVSVEVLKDGITEFSKESGLVLNIHKSTIFFGSVKENEKQRILEVMSFVVGTLPMKYLGVPLITKNIGVTECNQLVDRVKPKVNDWKIKNTIICRLAMHKRLATQDRIMVWNKNISLVFPLCKKENDSHEHLFFKCPYSEDIWRTITTKIGRRNWSIEWEKVAYAIAKGGCKNSINSVLERMAFETVIYFIWNEMNKRIFTQEHKSYPEVLNGIVKSLKMQLMCLKVRSSVAVKKICDEWNLNMNIIQ